MKKRILFLIPAFKRGGGERYLIDFCNELLKRDEVEFLIGVLFNENQYQEDTKDLPIEYISYSPYSLFKTNSNEKLLSLISTFKPEIIHTHLYLAEFVSSYYPDPSITYICHCHDNMEPFRNFSIGDIFNRIRWYELLEKRILISNKYNKVNTYFIANSANTSDYFKRVLPPKMDNNVILLYYGFNFQRFKTASPRILTNDQPIRILNVGSFQKKKNQSLLIEIARILKKRNIPFEMNLIGDGELKSVIISKIIENNLEQNVFCRGIIYDVEKWYHNSDIYIHSAYYEPFGLVFLEAMAARLPIISLDGKGNQDLIINGENGYLIKEQKPEDFVEKIMLLKNHPEKYTEMGNNGFDFAGKFDISVHVQNMIALYKNLLVKNNQTHNHQTNLNK